MSAVRYISHSCLLYILNSFVTKAWKMRASERRLSIFKEEHMLDEDLKSIIIDRSQQATDRSFYLTRKWLDSQSIVLVRCCYLCHWYPQYFLPNYVAPHREHNVSKL